MFISNAIHQCVRGERSPLIMGIINVTPDSFSDGGCFLNAERAQEHARCLWEEGADILDVGAESTRPGFVPVSEEEEWRRLEPVICQLVSEKKVLSVDTTKASVARKALKAGVSVVNDVWGLQADPDMASVVAESNAMIVVMHNRKAVEDQIDLWDEWRTFFDRSLLLAQKAGIASHRIILDPGIGFGKTLDQNIQALRLLKKLRCHYSLPVLLGLSRKSLFGKLLGLKIEERLAATLSANILGIEAGASLVRVHDVKAHRDALELQHIIRKKP